MSGPYSSPGYPQDGQWHGESAQFPTVQYSGLGGWGNGAAPGGPPPRRSTGRTIVAVVSVLVIIGGVATGIVLLQRRHAQHQTVSPPQSVTTSASAPAAGFSDGTADLALSAGSCVTAVVGSDDEYRALSQVTCGGADSDLVLAMKTSSMDGCADHQYLRLSTPSSGYYCFTLDIKQGDCVDRNYLKTPCAEAAYLVLRTEPGPGSDSSCTTTTGATHWVPVGRDPVEVGCLGPPGSS